MKLRWVIWVLGAFLIVSCSNQQTKQTNRGVLIIIGGGSKPANAIEEFVRLCDGGQILVMTSASGVPEESGPETVDLLKKNGAADVKWLHIAGKDTANADSTISAIQQSRGLFFTGGDQVRFMRRIGGTKAEKAILELYQQKGGIIAGTSAGAAVQSEVMITGNGDFATLDKDNVETIHGLGLLTNCIIDQHFIARRRNNRLISVVAEKGLPGIGIDESTAILYFPDDTFKVLGKRSVVVYNPAKASFPEINSKKVSIANLSMTVLAEGQGFDLKTGNLIEYEKSSF